MKQDTKETERFYKYLLSEINNTVLVKDQISLQPLLLLRNCLPVKKCLHIRQYTQRYKSIWLVKPSIGPLILESGL